MSTEQAAEGEGLFPLILTCERKSSMPEGRSASSSSALGASGTFARASCGTHSSVALGPASPLPPLKNPSDQLGCAPPVLPETSASCAAQHVLLTFELIAEAASTCG